MDLSSFINEGFVIMIPVLYVLGLICKHIPNIPDYLIIFILLFFSIGMGIWSYGLNPDTIFNAILCVGASNLINQTYKQMTVKRIEDTQIKINGDDK